MTADMRCSAVRLFSGNKVVREDVGNVRRMVKKIVPRKRMSGLVQKKGLLQKKGSGIYAVLVLIITATEQNLDETYFTIISDLLSVIEKLKSL